MRKLNRIIVTILTILLIFINSSNCYAESLSIDELYKNAYNATQVAQKEKTQISINNARDVLNQFKFEAIAQNKLGLLPHYNTFSVMLDEVQQPILTKIVNTILEMKKAGKATQDEINNIRLLVDPLPASLKNACSTWSSEVDKFQNELLNQAVAAVKNAEIEKTQEAIDKAQELVNELSKAIREGIKKVATDLQARLDEILGIKPVELKVHYIDVGQGDAILIQQNNENILIDGGSTQYADTVLNYLSTNGVNTLKYVIATHPHEDHIGSLSKIIDTLNVENIMMPKVTHTSISFEKLITSISNKGLKIITPKSGDNYSIGAATLEILPVASLIP